MEKIIRHIKTAGEKINKSKLLVRILYALGILIIVKLIFFAGVIVGFNKASYGRAWGEHYNENFGMGHRNPRMMGIGNPGMMDYFPNAHGAAGKIIKIEDRNIIVADKDNTEKVIFINDDTKIQKERTDIQANDLRVDDFIVVIGAPDVEGVINAKLIRVIPSPEFLQ